MSWSYPSLKRTLALCTLFLTCLAAPVPAQPTTPEDPRDREIRELRQRLEEQQSQIDQLRQTLEGLLRPSAQAEPSTQADPTIPTPAPEGEHAQDPGPEPPPASAVQTDLNSSATGSQPSMNPNISVSALLGGQKGGRPEDAQRNTFFVEEVELALQAPVDPKTRLDAFIGFHSGETPEVEEAYATYTGLPGGLQARAGLFLNEVGRINTVHTHALPQIDRPLPAEEFFGHCGLRSPGIELSWLAPVPWYSKATVQMGSRYGHAHEHAHEHGEEGHDEAHHAFELFPSDGNTRPLWVARLENMAELNQDTTLMLGLSGATSTIHNHHLESSRIGGADLTLKWSPLDNPYRNLVWQTEYLVGRQKPMDQREEARDFDGWYSFLNYRFNRNWRAGVRYDETDLPMHPGERQRRASALLEFLNSEWSALRFQYSRYNPTFSRPFDEFQIQWNLTIGPHGAHKY
ncbi:MAG: hypothetical protein GX934_02365 [Burkholderiales bacterium]|nr:hypothetical protein [Burkholderiales bacterium]